MWHPIPAGDPLCLTVLLPGELVLALLRGEDSVQELAGPAELEQIPCALWSRPPNVTQQTPTEHKQPAPCQQLPSVGTAVPRSSPLHQGSL